jgi:CheY-like chemotaxis protein
MGCAIGDFSHRYVSSLRGKFLSLLQPRHAPTRVPRFLIAEEISSLRAVKSDSEEDMPMRNTGAKILVVDDERAIASTLAMILEYQGYKTAVAFSGEEAVEVAGSFQPDCIVSDVMMGAMNGIEAAMEILRALPYCKVLLISGNAGYGDLLEKARAKGFDFELLLKPVPPPELLARIEKVLSNSAEPNRKPAASEYPERIGTQVRG